MRVSLLTTILGSLQLALPLLSGVAALGKTDYITWGEGVERTGYSPNHNLDPAVVRSASFGQLWRASLPGTWPIAGKPVKEQIFASPLVYTSPVDAVQYLYVATTQNNVYKLNAKTGAIIASRQLHRPFLVADLDGCVDINPTIGVTATGVIDPDANTWYLTAKTYIDQSPTGPTGRPNGRYYIHAISTEDLSERANFPVDLEGTPARNNPTRSFGGGVHHQRPALLHSGNYVYAGFASHCVQYNFTGWIIGWDKTTGALVERFATQGAGVPDPVKGAGVWMSGGGLASDGRGSMFFATGNGYASQLDAVPVNGRNPPTSLEEAAVHMSINGDGSLSVVDFFMPWEKKALDGGDKDLGTSPLQILPSQFSCGSVQRMGVVTGKSGKTYWLNLDDLGGYKNGPGGYDRVIQTYQNENSVYAGAGVYPLEGGYIYINVIQYPTHVFKFSCVDGVPSFSKIADSPASNAYVLGVSHGAMTSFDGQPGTGLLWVSDVQGSNLRVYDAIPQNGKLTMLKAFDIPSTTKFNRPTFGDGIVYQATTQGFLYAFGSPVNLPLNCTTVEFGTRELNTSSSALTVQCIANVAVSITDISLPESTPINYAITSKPTLPLSLALGQNVSFQAVFTPVAVGVQTASVILTAVAQQGSYSGTTPVQLRGAGQSAKPLLAISPNTVTWNGVITGQSSSGANQTLVLNNNGNTPLTITKTSFTVALEPQPSSGGTQVTGSATSVSAFTFYNLPTTIAPQSSVIVTINFNPSASGQYAVRGQITSDGGNGAFDVIAAGYDQSKALLEFKAANGTWQTFNQSQPFSFGDVLQNQNNYGTLRLTNIGSANAAPLSVTVSKPPFGIAGSIIGTVNQVDLGEGASIAAGQNLTASIFCSVPKSQIDMPAYNATAHWTMNLNDLTFGKQDIQFMCNAITEQASPLNPSTGQALYRYAGCFKENNPGRQLDVQVYDGNQLTNEQCIGLCSQAGYIFAGTQYHRQCWCGTNRPKDLVADANCDFECTGNVQQICGGDGVNNNQAHLSVFGDITRWNGNSTDATGPYRNPGSLGYINIGCYTDATSGRALTVGMPGNGTVVGCLQACKSYAYAALQYANECYCGDSLKAGSNLTAETQCYMPCKNNRTEICGGPSRNSMFMRASLSSLGASSSSTPSGSNSVSASSQPVSSPTSNVESVSSSASVSSPSSIAPSSAPSSGVSVSASSASSAVPSSTLSSGFASSVSASDSSPASSTAQSSSFSSSPTSTQQSSGSSIGSSASISISSAASSSIASSSASSVPLSSSAPSGSSSVVSSTVATPSQTSTSQWQALGCIADANPRVLPNATVTGNMTIEKCQSFCVSKNLPLVGLQYANECFCGIKLSAAASAPQTGCTMPCSGNSTQICGGNNRLSVYNNTQYVPTSHAQSITVSLSTSTARYVFQGCYKDGNPRTLPSLKTATNNMTQSTCVSTCFASGYKFAGAEYGRECWCANDINASAPMLSESECNMQCAGEVKEWCGGSSKLSVYKKVD